MSIFSCHLFSMEQEDLLLRHQPLQELLTQFGGRILHEEKNVEQYLKNQQLSAEVDLTIVSKAEIKEINQAYRQVDRETDVLSFPAFEFTPDDPASDFVFLPFDFVDPDSDQLAISLGEIIICPAIVKIQANNLHQSYLREFLFLFMHGLLHLCGYDHQSEEQEESMFSLQRALIPELDSLSEDEKYKEFAL